MIIKKLLNNKPFCNDFHFFLFSIILICLTINHKVFIIPLILFMFFILKKTTLFIPIFITILIFLFSYYYKITILYNELTEINETFIIEEVKPNYYIVKNNKKYVVYGNSEFKPGDIVNMNVEIIDFEYPSYDWDFDSKKYYYSKNIVAEAKINNYEIIDSKVTINRIKYSILEHYQTKLKSKTFDYLSSIVFGENILNDEVKEAYSDLNVSHILAISGMHIMLIYSFIKKLMNKIFKVKGDYIATSIIFLYVGFIGFGVSSLRALLFILIELVNLRGYLKYTKLDILSISCVFMLLINPFYMYQSGFILTFLVSFILIFMNEFLSKYSKITIFVLSTVICILATLPIVININHSINLLGFVFAIFLTNFLPKPLVFMSFLALILPVGIYEFFYIGLDYLLLHSSVNIFNIKMVHLNIYMIIVYYFIFILFLIGLIKNSNVHLYFSFLVVYLVAINFISGLNPYYEITFIDVGQGDSCLISTKYGKNRILIDTFNNVDYLKGLGNIKIDFIFLSHLDYDHVSDIDLVLENYNVKKVYYSCFADENKIPKCFDYRWEKVKFKDKFYIDGIEVLVMSGFKKYESENDNSLILRINILENIFLFMGDASTIVEDDLVNIGCDLKCDVLKVGHHGSITSSSERFLRLANPNDSIISVGKNNKYGLPNFELLNCLKKYSYCYMTSENGNIAFKIKKSGIIVKPYKK